MKMILTLKTEKKEPTKKELNKTVSVILRAGYWLNKKLKFKEVRCHCMRDGTSLILTK